MSAVELGGEIVVINDELAGALLDILKDEGAPEALRARAAISFGPILELADVDPEEMDDWEEETGASVSPATIDRIGDTLRQVYQDADAPRLVRRRALEASVRSPQDWHKDAVRAAYADNDADWRLTAVFSMEFIGGFERQILDSLESQDSDVLYHAVIAAGNWQVEAAWETVAGLVTAGTADKDLLLAAIEAVAGIDPKKARAVLRPLLQSDDEDIAAAAVEAMEYARLTGRLKGNSDFGK